MIAFKDTENKKNGLSCVELLKIEKGQNGVELLVGGADLISGTPIYDIKPYLPFVDSRPEAPYDYTLQYCHNYIVVYISMNNNPYCNYRILYKE